MKFVLGFVIYLSLFGQSFASGSDFDKVCGYFDELKTQISKGPLTPVQKKKFIDLRVAKNLQPNSPARQSWEVILYGKPEVRYELFKTSAEASTKQKWTCKSMEALLPSTGE